MTVPIVGELQDKAFIIVCPGCRYLFDLHRSPEQIASRQRAEIVLSPLRSVAKLIADPHIAKSYLQFVTVEHPGAEVLEVSAADPQLGTSIHRAKLMPDTRSQQRRAENMQSRVSQHLALKMSLSKAFLLLIVFCLGSSVFAQTPAGAGSEHHHLRPHIHRVHKPHLHRPHVRLRHRHA